MRLKTALIIPDCHIPWHDEKAYSLMLKVARDIQDNGGIDEVVILGDYLDFYHCSFHSKLPEDFDVKVDLQEEIRQGVKKLKALRKIFKRSKIVFLEGNHEFRLKRYLTNQAPELFGLIKLETLLNLDELNIELIPYGKYQKHHVLGTDMIARHEPINAGINCAGGTLNKAHQSIIFGHTHRLQTFSDKTISGKDIEAASLGWLGDSTQPPFAFIRNADKWVNGFGMVYANRDNVYLHAIKIEDHTCVYNGKLYK